MSHVNKCRSASFFLFPFLFFWCITYTRRSAQIIRVQCQRFSGSEHTCVASSQIKKQTIVSIPEASLPLSQSPPLSKVTTVLTSTSLGLALPAFELHVSGIIWYNFLFPLSFNILFVRCICILLSTVYPPSGYVAFCCTTVTTFYLSSLLQTDIRVVFSSGLL